MRITKRLLVALTLTACLLAGFAAPASSSTRNADVPVDHWDGPTFDDYDYPNPGNPDNPTMVHPVNLNVWYPLQWDGCSQEVRVGIFYNYPYAEMRYVSGTCDFGGVSLATWSTFSGGYVYTKPSWNSPGFKGVCVVGSPQSGSCVQSGSGSIWNQQSSAQAPYQLLGANAVICGDMHYGPFPKGGYNKCLTVNYGIF